MKNLMIIISMSCILFVSCEESTGGQRDLSLAGSISYTYIIAATGSYNDTSLGELQEVGSYMDIKKLSETEISMFCKTKWEGTNLDFEIPSISVLGEPDNVAFDYISTDAKVTYNDTEYTSVSVTLKGWMKEQNFGAYVAVKNARSADGNIYTPAFFGEIKIVCTIDYKEIELTITSMRAIS